jgi:hypothetical protein
MNYPALILIICFLILWFLKPYVYNSNSNPKNPKIISVYRINNNLDYDKPSLAIPPQYTLAKTDNYYDCTCLLLESLNQSEQILEKIVLHNKIKVLFAFKGIDVLCHKLRLAKCFMRRFPELVPLSYDLKADMNKIKSYLRSSTNNYVILKKNVQQQEGIYITQDINSIISDDYVVCQQLLQNPLTVANHKINIRVYIIVTTFKGKTQMYRFNDGFIYYAPLKWQSNVSDLDVNITSGLKDRKLYENNPLTYQDLLLHLRKHNGDILDKNIQYLSSAIKKCYSGLISDKNKSMNCVCTQILGCDIAPSDDFGVKLMEINKGPDMRFKDERDGALKRTLTYDYQNLLFKSEISERLIPII